MGGSGRRVLTLAAVAVVVLAWVAPAAQAHEALDRGHGIASRARPAIVGARGSAKDSRFAALQASLVAPRQNVEYVTGSNGFTGGHVVVEGDRLYVGAYGLGFRIFDISEPAAPRLIGGYTPGDRADAVPDAAVIDGRHIAVLNGTRRVSSPFPNDVRTDRSEFLDVTDPANPRLLWTFIGQDDGEAHNGDIDDERRLWFPSGGTGAVTTPSANFTHRGLRIYDLSPVLQDPPQAPRRITGVNPVVLWENSPWRRGREVGPAWNHTHDVELYNDHPVRQPDGTIALRDILLLAEGDSYDDSPASAAPNAGSVFIIDVTDPANPVALLRWMHNRESPGHEAIRYHHEAQFLDGDPSVLFITDEDLHGGCGTGGGVTAIRVSPDLTSATELSDWYIPAGTPAPVCSVHVMSSYRHRLFLGSYNAGLQVVDYSDPANPRQAGYYIAQGSTAWGALYHEGLVYVGDMSRGLDVFRFTPPLPDLALTSGDIALSSDKVVGGDRVTITATVHNDGDADATGVAVRFTDDGREIGSRTIASIPAGGSAQASVTWETKGLRGTRTLTVTADPAGTIAEHDETNNTASRSVEVRGNKVRNGDFEQSSNGSSPDHWSSAGSTGYDGHTASAGPGGAWLSDAIPVDAGERLGFSVAASGAAGRVLLEQLSAAGAVLASLPLDLTDTLTVGEGVTAVRIRLAGGLVGTTTFDDVQLWED